MTGQSDRVHTTPVHTAPAHTTPAHTTALSAARRARELAELRDRDTPWIWW